MKKISSKGCFTLAVTFAAVSVIWFATGSFGAGMIQAGVAVCELALGIYYRQKEKNDGR